MEEVTKKSYLIKFSYFGPEFQGFALGNSENTVEGIILEALKKTGISDKLRTSSRTDKFVSAISNCIYLESDHDPEKILGILNSTIRNISFHSWAIVETGFNPRHSLRKTYTYLLKCDNDRKESVKKILSRFIGTHDFRNFCKVDTRNTIRTIEKIDIRDIDDFLLIDITGKSFLWQQIRFIVGYADFFSRTDKIETDPFSGNIKRPTPASPLYLFLKDIDFKNVEFNRFKTKTSKQVEHSMNQGLFSYLFFKELLGEFDKY
ncbi:MAG: pseudouridine synthase family protein [Thermoplasmataceae archaeon]